MNATFNLKRFLLLEQYKRNETGRHLLWSAAVVPFICILCILHDELGAVVNIILPRRETGGVVNFQLSDSPHTLWGENFLSTKFNYKNSEWGIDYFNKNSEYHSRLESHETFYLGDRTIDRIKEGIEDESPSLSFINNLNLTYNLTKADKYVFNAIFRNNLSNAPYQS